VLRPINTMMFVASATAVWPAASLCHCVQWTILRSTLMTEKIYYRDSYQRSFSAVVKAKQDDFEGAMVQLDQTCFYPTSGGQPCDRGQLAGFEVLVVEEEGGAVLHLLQGNRVEVGQAVEGEIDWSLRFDHMQQHTGQHLLSQAFTRVLEAETVSFHLGRESATIDLARDDLTSEDICRVEDLANRVIFESRPIEIRFVDSQEQHDLPLRKLSEREGMIRVIEIADFDFSACGGTHCRSTGEVGLIKIRKWERAKKRARVEFYCGWRALRDYRWKNHSLSRLSQLYSKTDREVVEAAQEHLEREDSQRKEISELRDSLLSYEAEELLAGSQVREGVQVVCEILQQRDPGVVQDLMRRIVRGGEKRIVLLGLKSDAPFLCFGCSSDLPYNMGEWIREAAPLIDGRGGGNPNQAQAKGSRPEGLSDALGRALELI